MAYLFSARSLSRLEGLHPDLMAVAHRAIAISEVDFAITEGRRSIELQREFVRTGASKTLDGRHLTGHAIDVAAVVGNTIRWEWVFYPKIAHAFRQAGVALHVPLRWGACWDRTLTEITYDLDDAAQQYVERWRRQNPGQKGPLVDGPHFELLRKAYPVEPPAAVVTA